MPEMTTSPMPRVNRQTKPGEWFASASSTSAEAGEPSLAVPRSRANRESRPQEFFDSSPLPEEGSVSASAKSLSDTLASELHAEVSSYLEHLRKFQELVRKYSRDTPTDREAVELNANSFDLEQHAQYVRAELDRMRPPLVPERLHDQLSQTFQQALEQAEGIIEFASRRAKKRFTMTTDPRMMHVIENQQAQIQLLQQQQEIAYDPRWESLEPLLAGGQLFEYTDDDIIRDQNTEVQALAHQTQELQQTYTDYSAVVAEQGQQLQIAEQHVEQTQANVNEGVKQIVSTQKSKRYKGLTLGSAIVGGVVGGAAGIVLGPVGIVLGAVGGFAAGGVAGHKTGKAIQRKQNRDIVRIEMDAKWVPDENAKNCYGCQKEFTQVRRRHHCRSCGEIFCKSCSKNKIKVPGLSIDRTSRVCDNCYNYISAHPESATSFFDGAMSQEPGAEQHHEGDPNATADLPPGLQMSIAPSPEPAAAHH